jgi:hypothetical protein
MIGWAHNQDDFNHNSPVNSKKTTILQVSQDDMWVIRTIDQDLG